MNLNYKQIIFENIKEEHHELFLKCFVEDYFSDMTDIESFKEKLSDST